MKSISSTDQDMPRVSKAKDTINNFLFPNIHVLLSSLYKKIVLLLHKNSIFDVCNECTFRAFSLRHLPFQFILDAFNA